MSKSKIAKKGVRSFELRDLKVDEAKRTIEFPFSSEEPVSRWYGNEILSHKNGAPDFARLNNGGALLFNHDSDNLIGVVERAWLGDDGRAYCSVRFSNCDEGIKRMEQVQDGILRNVSFGYMINNMTRTAQGDDGDTFTADSWTPYEVSFVAVPADPTVGVGRALESDEGFEIDEKKSEQTEIQPAPVIVAAIKGARSMDENEQRIAEAKKAERQSVAAILAMGEKFKLQDVARELVAEGRSLEEAKVAFLEKMGAIRAVPEGAADLDLTEKQKRDYSLVRALRAAAARDWKGAGFEAECSAEIAKRSGKETAGFFLPTNIMLDASAVRAVTSTSANGGGNLVATNLLAGSFIDILRAKARVLQMGAQMLSGLVGNVAVPRLNGAATAYWVAENGAITESEASFDQVTLSPKTIVARSQVTRQMLMQSTPSVEALVRNDLAQILALGIDAAAIKGTGSSGQPTGILNVSGIGSVVGGTNGAAVSINNLIDLETAVAAANADEGSLAYMMNAVTVGALKKLTSTTGQYLWTNSPMGQRSGTPGEINGYPVARTNQVPSNLTKGSASGICSAVLFANWNDLIIGEWGVLEILPNPFGSGYNTGALDIRAMQSVDVAVRHAASFAAMVDALTA